jgi:L-lysine 6-oxidase
MAIRYEIHPSIGIARVGDAPASFYLAPEAEGALPLECDRHGNPIVANGPARFVTRLRDKKGRIRRQGARFRVFACDDTGPSEAAREITGD